MHFTTATGIVLAFGATASAGWIKELAPRTSPSPCISYSCPNIGGFDTFEGSSISGGTLTCN